MGIALVRTTHGNKIRHMPCYQPGITKWKKYKCIFINALFFWKANEAIMVEMTRSFGKLKQKKRNKSGLWLLRLCVPGQSETIFFLPVRCSFGVAVAADGLGTARIFQIDFLYLHGWHRPGKVMEFNPWLEKSWNFMLTWKNGILPRKVIENQWKSLKNVIAMLNLILTWKHRWKYN